MSMAHTLTAEDREILAFERHWWKFPEAKETQTRERFGLTMAHYYNRLNWIIEQPEALELDPLVVRRLRRQRAGRVASRLRD